MTTTYNCIATTTLSTATASVTFSSISGTYTDLILIISGASSNDTQVQLQFNGDTSTNYSSNTFYGDGTSRGGVRSGGQTQGTIGGIASGEPSVNIIQIMNYSNTTTKKGVLGKYVNINSGYGEVGLRVVLWSSTSAITSIKVMMPSTYTYSSGCVFTLYGIKAE